MARLMAQDRYRMVNLQSGSVVVVFQLYPGMNPVKSCQRACNELDLDVACGCYRLDQLKQNTSTKSFHWHKIYRFSLTGPD